MASISGHISRFEHEPFVETPASLYFFRRNLTSINTCDTKFSCFTKPFRMLVVVWHRTLSRGLLRIVCPIHLYSSRFSIRCKIKRA